MAENKLIDLIEANPQGIKTSGSKVVVVLDKTTEVTGGGIQRAESGVMMDHGTIVAVGEAIPDQTVLGKKIAFASHNKQVVTVEDPENTQRKVEYATVYWEEIALWVEEA